MRKLLTIVFLFGVVAGVMGQSAGDFQTTGSGSGNWDDVDSWVEHDGLDWNITNTYPTNNISTTVTILNGHTINATANIIGANSSEVLQINDGGTLNMGSYELTGYTSGSFPIFTYHPFNEISIDGRLTTSNLVDVITMSIGSNGEFNTAFSSTGWWNEQIPSLSSNSGLIEFSGSSQTIVYDAGINYNDITVSGTVGTSGQFTINGDLTIDPSSTFTNTMSTSNVLGDIINNGTLNLQVSFLYLYGNLTNNGDITVNNNTTSIMFEGSGTSFSGSGTFSNSLQYLGVGVGTVGNLSISATAPIDVGSLFFSQSNDILSINTGAKITIGSLFGNSGDITINSDNSGSGSLISDVSISNVKHKRYVSGAQWHIISSAVSGYSISNYVSNNGIDTYNGDVALGVYDESTNGWSMYPNDPFVALPAAGNILTAKGYLSGRPTSGTLSFTGSLNVGNQSIGITSSASPGNAWNCIGNPYSSSINIVTLISANTALLDNSYEAIYVFNGTTYSALTTGYVQPGQGFFVKSAIGGGSFGFTSSMQSHQNPSFYKKVIMESDRYPEIKLLATSNGVKEAAIIRFSQEPTYGLDPGKDIGKFSGSGVNYSLYSQLMHDNGVKFEYQALPEDSIKVLSIPIGLNYKKGGSVTFSTEIMNLPAGSRVILEDRLLEEYIDLENASASYTVELPAETNGYGRFYLHTYDPSAVGTGISDLKNFSIFAKNKVLYINGRIDKPGLASVYDMLGKELKQAELVNGNTNTIDLSELNEGIYIIRVSNGNEIYSEKVFLR